MENPFIITGKIKPEYFCDREIESAKIIRNITTGDNIVLVAMRRIGKTKLIDYCLDSAKIKGNYITISIDILRTSSINEFVYEFGKAVFQQAASRGERMLHKVILTLKSINGHFGYDPISNTPTFNLSLGDIPNPLYTLEEIFACIEQAEKKCIIAIDEFQQICSYPEKNMEAILRTFIQKCSNANFIFSGSERHIITNMFSEKAHPFYNSATIVNLEPIAKEKYITFSHKLFNSFDKQISSEAIAYIYDTFDGNTYYMQKTLHETFNQTDNKQTATISTVQSIIESMILDYDHKFSETLSRLTLPQKELLYAIAKEGRAQQITSAKFIKSHNLRSASSIQTATRRLLEYHLITQSGGEYFVDDQLMSLWLNR